MGRKQALKRDSTAKKELQLDQRGDGLYSGTFRWTDQKIFPALPLRSFKPRRDSLQRGWQGYLSECHSTSLIPHATADPSFLDALSFPMTFISTSIALELDSEWNRDEIFNILVIGATVKAEQRIFAQTKYWDEIAAFFSEFRIKLWFIGPEVATKSLSSSAMQIGNFRGTVGEFLKDNPSMTPRNSILIGYNTGFGNFIESSRYDLFWSWLPDLYAIADSGIAAIFACANDYADLNGEFAIHTRILGSNMVLLPKENMYSAASHLHEEGKKDTAWSRANSFIYVVQGYDSSRQEKLRVSDSANLARLLGRDMDDLHLEDRLERHLFRGMILSKDQAARSSCIPKKSIRNQLNDNQAEIAHDMKTEHSSVALAMDGFSAALSNTDNEGESPNNQEENGVITPTYELVPSVDKKVMRITISTPRMTSAKEMELDISSKCLRFAVPGRYSLELELPWLIDSSGDGMQAVYVKRTRTLCIELRSA